jgi:predicted DNA-binding protein (UPF0251 family)
MRKITEILRLHYEQKLGQRQIAKGASVSQSTVHEYLARAEAAGIEWPLSMGKAIAASTFNHHYTPKLRGSVGHSGRTKNATSG